MQSQEYEVVELSLIFTLIVTKLTQRYFMTNN